MKAIALVQTNDRTINQLQQNFKQSIDPIIQNPLTQGNLINGVVLKIGNNTINHGLNAVLQGWMIVGINGVASIYDNQATNTNASSTLILNSSAAVTINLYCF
jgi:hypothetical protein